MATASIQTLSSGGGVVRKAISDAIQSRVLLRSRRRCCVCFGLDRDTKIKAGQIAHLDRNNQNNAEENLCFLCLQHHDEYDSKTSQRKNLTVEEVKSFRSELEANLNIAFSLPVHFGHVEVPKADPYAGRYIRESSPHESAEVNLFPLPDDIEGNLRYFLSGSAAYGIHFEYGPNIGMLDILLTSHQSGILTGSNPAIRPEYGPHTVTIRFVDGGFILEEQNAVGVYGMNVGFDGCYRKA